MDERDSSHSYETFKPMLKSQCYQANMIVTKRIRCLQTTQSVFACYQEIAAIDFWCGFSFDFCATLCHLYRNLSDISYRFRRKSRSFSFFFCYLFFALASLFPLFLFIQCDETNNIARVYTQYTHTYIPIYTSR